MPGDSYERNSQQQNPNPILMPTAGLKAAHDAAGLSKETKMKKLRLVAGFVLMAGSASAQEAPGVHPSNSITHTFAAPKEKLFAVALLSSVADDYIMNSVSKDSGFMEIGERASELFLIVVDVDSEHSTLIISSPGIGREDEHRGRGRHLIQRISDTLHIRMTD